MLKIFDTCWSFRGIVDFKQGATTFFIWKHIKSFFCHKGRLRDSRISYWQEEENQSELYPKIESPNLLCLQLVIMRVFFVWFLSDFEAKSSNFMPLAIYYFLKWKLNLQPFKRAFWGPILNFNHINDLWTTTTCQQRPLFLVPKSGRYTHFWLYSCQCRKSSDGYSTSNVGSSHDIH